MTETARGVGHPSGRCAWETSRGSLFARAFLMSSAVLGHGLRVEAASGFGAR
uniref:Uncharacterized protein n=1 Tax=uncultured marine virus TaxID=186617 RepID=A0A0F7LAJ5_9VIRU|nr:hypothetical protein [uncultured marine virus]